MRKKYALGHSSFIKRNRVECKDAPGILKRRWRKQEHVQIWLRILIQNLNYQLGMALLINKLTI